MQNESTRINVAYHEAGHAVCAVFLQRAFRHATIVADEEYGSLGCVEFHQYPAALMSYLQSTDQGSPRGGAMVECEVIHRLAGTIAEAKATDNGPPENSWRSDRKQMADIVLRVTGSADEAEAYVEWLRIRSKALVNKLWPAIEAVALALLDKKRLSRAEIRKICFDTWSARASEGR